MTTDESGSSDGKLPEALTRPSGISYLFIPATDTQVSGDFYAAVFGWTVDEGRPGHRGFRDGTGHVAGAFDTGVRPFSEPGLVPWIYVDDLDGVVERITQHGGHVVSRPAPEGDLRVARFRDPAGNILGVWRQQEPTRSPD